MFEHSSKLNNDYQELIYGGFNLSGDPCMHPIEYLWRAAERYPTEVAVVSPAGTLTFSQLRNEVLVRAAALIALDPQVGSRVCVGAANSVDHLLTILAVLAAAKVWVPLNPRNGDPELLRQVEFVAPALVVLDQAMMARVGLLVPQAQAIETLAQAESIVMGSVPLGPDSLQYVDPEQPQAIKFTGGTTGFPKGVLQPLRAWSCNIATQIHELQLGPSDRYLVAAPLTHGTSTYVLPVLGAGGALVFPEQSHPAGLLDAAELHAVTLSFMPPTLVMTLCEQQQLKPRGLGQLRYLIYGGAPMRPEQIRRAQVLFGPVLCTSFGQTEAPQIITFLAPSDMQGERLASVGRPSLMTRVAILDDRGRVQPVGEEGEIAVRGNLVMSAYFKAPEETAKTLTDGWLRTGDVGVMDEQGYLYLRDRLRDVIISGGFNVYPSDVEVVLSTHPDVIECAVVGVPDEKWGEAVHAVVRMTDSSRFDAVALIEQVKKELGSVKAPKQIHLVTELPRSPVGKILKSVVRQQIMSQGEQHAVIH